MKQSYHMNQCSITCATDSSRAHLDEQLPLWVVSGRDGIVQVLGGVAVVAASHCDGLILKQVLHACT